MSVDSVVFDVSSGRDFYGPGGAYSMFAGKEIGWALATMSFEEVYLGNLDTTGMSVAERSSMEEWIVKVRRGWGGEMGDGGAKRRGTREGGDSMSTPGGRGFLNVNASVDASL